MEEKSEFKVNLYAFQGPLDLLCHLVKKAEVNIYDIPIAEITDEYMEYISKWKEMDIEVTSEFLVMAARLMEIKAKMLLPTSSTTSVDNDEEEKDPRKDLINQLIEYKFYKNVAENLASKEREQLKLYTRMKVEKEENIEEETIYENLNVINLLEAFNRVVERKKRKEKVKDELNTIKGKSIKISVKDKKEFIIQVVKNSNGNQLSFFDLIDRNHERLEEIIVSFLALLDLVKENKVKVIQEGRFRPIWIKTPVLAASGQGDDYVESKEA